MILAPAAAKAVAAGVTEAPPLEPAHQALGNHLVKTLPVLLGNEDPGKHCGTRVRLSEENRCAAASCSAQSVKRAFLTQSHEKQHLSHKIHDSACPKNMESCSGYILFQQGIHLTG